MSFKTREETTSLLRECRLALDELLKKNPTLSGSVCGSTTLGNLRANLYDFRDTPSAFEQQLAETQSKLAQMVAENAGLKAAIEKHADSYIMCGYCRTERDGKNDDVCEVLGSTSATDAFLAEVRAQGVEMFAESQKEYVRKNRSELDSMTRAAYCGSAVDADRFAAQLRKGGAE